MPMFRLLLCLVASCVPVAAQIMSGSISGTLRDTSGAALADARLTLTHIATGVPRSVVSDNSGDFLFNAVDGGDYNLRIEKAGFKVMQRTNLVLATGDRIALGNITIEVGAVSDTV